jgi:hypothetical protein
LSPQGTPHGLAGSNHADSVHLATLGDMGGSGGRKWLDTPEVLGAQILDRLVEEGALEAVGPLSVSEIWRVKLSDATFTLYKNGTLYSTGSATSGAMVEEAWAFIDTLLPRRFASSERTFWIGLDERGKGELVGHLTLACALVPGTLAPDVGIAVFLAAVWVVRDVASLNRTRKPAVPGSSPTTHSSPPASAVGTVPRTDYLLDLGTGQMTPLPKSIRGGGYAATPDGSRLAFTQRGDNGKPQIFVANLDGTGIEQVTHDFEAAFSPAWSPDGSKIAFIGYHDDKLHDLFVVDLATGQSTQLSFSTWEPDPAVPDFDPWRSSLPSFTPDGGFIVYNASRGDNIDRVEAELRIVPVAGGDSVPLMRDRSKDGTAAFDEARLSPDGSLLSLFCGESAGSVCVANADGTDHRELVSIGDGGGGGGWSPDGTRIVYFAFHSQDVFIVDVATGEVTNVGEGMSSAWLDDHTLIVEIAHCYDPVTGSWGFHVVEGCNKG